MITIVTPQTRAAHRSLIHSYGRLRSLVFKEKLNWDVCVTDGCEFDRFDQAVNILVLETIGENVVGGMRLMPMHQPNLMNTTFSHLLPDAEDFRSPSIWEVTRYCIDEKYLALKSSTGASVVSMRVAYQSLVITADMGGTHHIAVVDPRTLNLIRLSGAQVEVLGRERRPDGSELVCGIWSIDGDFIERMQWVKSRLPDSMLVTA